MIKLIYLASPHSHPDRKIRQQRHDDVCKFAADLMKRGFQVFCPIAHSHNIAILLDDPAVFDFEYWVEFDFKMIKLCDELYVAQLDGWQESRGVQAEIEYAKALGMKISYIGP
ncbi:MAG: DUF1937 family protein [Proteobacteria bacterium]|nr:DUF1937 family protein [Pseudomonadota bacterium]